MPTPSSQPNPNFDFAEPAKRSPPVPDAFKAPPPGSVAKFEPPPATRIFPQPINPPPAPAQVPAPPPSRPGARTGGRIAGSFKMPPGSGAAARGGAAVVGRRIPYVALAFLAYDAYQLACAFQLIPGSACPRPDNPNPGGKNQDFSGGQCLCIQYRLRVEVNGQFKDNAVVFGPISEFRTRRAYPDNQSSGNTLFEVLCRGTNATGCVPTSIWVVLAQGSNVPRDSFPYTVATINRVDGQADNCGNPPTQPSPQGMPDQINNITNFNRNINLNFNVPNPRPPSPQPKPAPRLISPPSPFPDININFGDNYFGGGDTDYDFDIDFNFSPAPKGNFNDYPDIFNNFPPSPQPQTRDPDPFPKENPPPQPAPQPKPIPELPPPLPDKLPENSTEQDKYIYRQNKETLDKVYKANAEILEIQEEQKKQGKILENIQSLLDFEVEGSQLIKRCDDIEIFYSYKDKVLKAISKQLDHVKAIEQTIINEVCSIEADTIAAVPDSWAVKLRVNVPQIALIFRAGGTKTYYKLTIPHPLNINKLVNPPIETYRKGNWQAIITCIDNSKFIVHCATREEAGRVANIAMSLIHSDWLGQTPRIYFAERRGQTVSEGTMTATSAMLFFEGQKNAIPEWRVAFKKDGK